LLLGTLYQGYIYSAKEKFAIRFHFNKAQYLGYLKFGAPFLLSGILAMVNCNVDRIIIRFTRSPEEAGIYASAYYIILFLTNIIALFFTPIFPLFIQYFHEGKKEKLQNIFNQTAEIISIVALPITVGGVLLSKEIINLLFHRTYEAAAAPFAILMLYIFMLFFREIHGYGLNAWNMEKSYLKIVALSSSMNLLLNLILTPKFGMVAAAWITVGSEVINVILMKHYADKIVKYKLKAKLVYVLLANVLMGIVVLLLKRAQVSTIFIIILSALVYLVAVFLFKILKVSELKKLFLSKNEEDKMDN
jgi:O-antigen/teichoic acid export membrane protein